MITGAETAHLSPKIPTIYLDGKLPLVVEKTAEQLGLRDGQVIQATVEAKLEKMRLNLQGLQEGKFIDLPKELPAGLRLAAGDTALFRVQVLSNGSILLRPLQAAPAPALPALPALPGNMPPSDSLQSLPGRTEQLGFRPPDMHALTQLLQPGVLDGLLQNLKMSGPALGALQQWLRLRPSMAQLTPEKLQQAMQRSGFITENLLAQGQGGGLVDLKSILRQLLRSGSSSESHSLIGDSLDDIESRQLMAQESLTGREWVFSMMLPFADAEPVAMRFARSKRLPGQAKPPLVIHLHTRNRDLGEVWLQTRITDQTDVDMVMWALREDVVLRAQSLASHLSQELDSAGLHMTRLQIIHGAGPKEPAAYASPDTGSLLDVRT